MPGIEKAFPQTPYFVGLNEPVGKAVDLKGLAVTGTIPAETRRHQAEVAVGHARFGKYRNPFTDDADMAGVDRTVANTTPVWHAGKLLMAKEDGRPYMKGGAPQALPLDPGWCYNEPVHVPSAASGHEGWLIVIVDHQIGENAFEHFAWVLEAGAIAKGPVAQVRIPARLQPQVHGWWVPQAQLDAAQYAMFDAMGIPRRPVDDLAVGGIPWNSDDMVTFGQAIREGYLAIRSDDVERLLGRKSRSVRALIEANAWMLRAAAGLA